MFIKDSYTVLEVIALLETQSEVVAELEGSLKKIRGTHGNWEDNIEKDPRNSIKILYPVYVMERQALRDLEESKLVPWSVAYGKA